MARILLNEKIIKSVKEKFHERRPSSKWSIPAFIDDLIVYLEESKNESFAKEYDGYTKIESFFSESTIGNALKRGGKSEYGAEPLLSNLLCYYSFKGVNYKTVVEKILKSTVDKEIEEDAKIKGRKQNIVDESKSPSTNKRSDTSIRDNKIPLSPFLNPEKNNETSYLDVEIKDTKPKKVIVYVAYVASSLVLLFLLALLVIFNTSKTILTKPINAEKPSMTPFDTANGSYSILLFPFQPLGNCQYKSSFEKTIITRLRDMNYMDNLNLQIEFDSVDCIHESKEATSIGKKLNANLVIWGDLYDDNKGCLKFADISDKKNLVVGISEIQNIASLSEIMEGKLQENVDYIIYWVAALRANSKSDYSTALNHYKKIEKLGITSAELFSNMATCFYSLDSINEAKIYYKKALEINPEYVNANWGYALLLQHKFHGGSDAKEHYEKALKIDSNDARIHLNYANLLATKLNDGIGARKHLEKVLVINPDFADAHYNYAVLLKTKFNDTLGALDHLEKVLKIDPTNAQAHFYCGILLHNSLEAMEHFKKALLLNPKYAEAHFNYGLLIYSKFCDSLLVAIGHLEKALNIKPDFAEAHLGCSKLLRFNKDKEGARKHYLKAIQLNPAFKNKESDSYFGIK